ncbi:MAG TPA: hypothetical protein VFU37_23835 [Pyrinomonadaceae bacterium]|nr:hypothetical protein [Pyrinomonadaceae bacterium]
MLKHPRSNIRPFISVIFAVLCWCIPAVAQEGTCSLKFDQLKEAPELFGFHLGMTLDQVKGRSALIKFGPADKFGVVKTSINPHYEPGFDKTEFAGVRTISLDFLDGKLVSLWVGYDETFKWPKLENFIANFSKSLNVPADWPAKRIGRELTCDGFSLSASIIAGGPALRIADEIAQNTIAERREKAAEEAEAEVVGDTRTLQYYPSDCSAKDDVPSTSRTIFKNKVEAESAGYKLAKVCQ